MNKLKHSLYNFWNSQDTRTRKYNRNVIYSFILKGLGILISLLLIPITLNYLNRYEYGIWITLNSILTWVNYFDIGLGNGLRNKLTEALATKDYNLGKAYVSTTFVLLGIIAICIGVIVTILNCFIDWNHLLNVDKSVQNLSQITTIVIWCLCMTFVFRTVGVIYIAYQDIWINNLLTFLGSIVSFIWIFILTKFTTGSLLNVAIAYSLSPLAVYIVAYWIVFYKHHPELQPSYINIKLNRYSKEIGGLGVKFFILQLTSLIVFSTSNFIISRLFTPNEVTPYNIAYRYFNAIIMSFYMITAPLWSAITDALKQKDVNWITSSIRKMGIYCCVFSLISFIFVAISQPIFKIWIGNSIYIPYSLSISLAIYSSVLMWATIVSSFSNGIGDLRLQLWSSISSAILFIPLAIILSKYGVEGIVIAMTIVSLIPAVLLTFEYNYKIKFLKKHL